MRKKTSSRPGTQRHGWRSTPSIAIAGVALFVVLGGSAVAASGLIRAGDIGPGAVTSRAIRNGGVEPKDLSAGTRALLTGEQGAAGARGETGTAGTAGGNGADGAEGSNGANGANGPNGPSGANGAEGAKGSNGANGANGANGPNGANGTNGIDGTDGANGIDGTDGTDGANGINGTNGSNGTITPLSAKQGLTALPTTPLPTTVVELSVPAGNYVVLAKTNLSHTGAGDSVECALKAGTISLDQIAMKTLPALAAIPAALQAVTTIASLTQLSVQCSVSVANGSANYSSLIAIPTA
jgi:hypothetical protein